jgi:hypothetical protein
MRTAGSRHLFSLIILITIMGLHGGTGCAGSIHHAEMREVRASPYILVFGVSDEEKSIMFAAQNIRVLIQRYGIARNGNLGILGGEEGEIRIERISRLLKKP